MDVSVAKLFLDDLSDGLIPFLVYKKVHKVMHDHQYATG